MKVHLTRSAVIDLMSGRDFYDEQEPGIGDYFVSTIAREIGSLAVTGGSHRKRVGMHCCPSDVFPYAIYYRIEDGAIGVYAILDSRRDPKRIRRALLKRKPER